MRRRYRVVLLATLFLVILVGGLYRTPYAAGANLSETTIKEGKSVKSDETKVFENARKWPYHFDESEKILIIYDSLNPYISEAAKELYSVTSLLYDPVELIGVDSEETLKETLYENYGWISIYVFNTTIEGISVSGEIIPWLQFVKMIKRLRGTNHVLGIGNTYMIEPYVTELENVYYTKVEQIDLMLVFVYSVWAVGEILNASGAEFKEVALDFTRIGLKIYADNFNEIFSRTVYPALPLGERDIEARKELLKEKVLKRFPVGARRIGFHPPGELTLEEYLRYGDKEATTTAKSEDIPPPRAMLVSEEDLDILDLFPIIGVPISSGLDGPVGKVIDLLLTVVTNPDIGIGDVIGLPTDIVEQLLEAFEEVYKVLGFVGELDGKSALEAFLDIIVDEFPVLAEYKKYLNLLINAFYVLRGEFDEIVDMVWDIIDCLFPDLGDATQSLKSILNETLSLSTELFEALSDSTKIFDTLFSWFSNHISENLIYDFLNRTLGLDLTQIEQAARRIVNTVMSIIDLTTSFNVTSFLMELKEKAIQYGFELLEDSIGSDALDKIMKMTDLALLVAGFSDKSLKEVLLDLVTEFIDVSYFKNQLEGAEEAIEDIISEIDEAIKEAKTNLEEFKNQVIQIINDHLQTATAIENEVKQIIADVTAMVATIMNTNFPKADMPTIGSLVIEILDYALPSGYTSGGLSKSEVIETLNNTFTYIMSAIAIVSDNDALKQYLFKTVEDFAAKYGLTRDALKDLVDHIIKMIVDSSTYQSIKSKIQIGADVASVILDAIKFVKENSFQGIFVSFLTGLGYSLVDYYDLDLQNYTVLMQVILPKVMGIEDIPSIDEAIDIVMDALGSLDPTLKDQIEDILYLVLNIRDIFTDGIRWLFNQIMDWLFSKLDELINSLTGQVGNILDSFSYDILGGDFALELGTLSAFGIHFALGIDLGFNFDKDKFYDYMSDIIFSALKWEPSDIDFSFNRILSFFEISPLIYAELEVKGFGSEENEFMDFLLESLGLELTFSGGASFKIQLFSFKAGAFDLSEFFKVVEWSFYFNLETAKDFTLLDFFTGGVGGSALSTLAEYIGLDAITITVYFGIMVEIIKRAASATGPEQAKFTLEITIGAALDIGIDIIIAGISFYGSLEVVLTFMQDLLGSVPLTITLKLIAYVSVTISFLFWDIDVDWGPETLAEFEFTAGSPEEAKDRAMGFDSDGDGLSDDYESQTPGLKPDAIDSVSYTHLTLPTTERV